MTITHPTRSRLLSIFFILTATFSLTGIVLIDQFSPTTIPIIADIEERDGQISIPSNTTTTRSTYTPPTIIQARPDRPTVIVNPASTTTSTPPKQDKPPAPTTTRDILEDAYNQQYDEDNRYGDLQDDDSYMGPNEYTASDGLGVISGTYIAPNGKRYDVATAATARASAQHTETVSEIISNLSTEEFDSLINNIKQDIQDNNEINNIGDISDQDAFNQLFNQTLIYDESTREFILAEQEYNAQGFQAEFDSEEKRTSYFNNFNLYLNQAYKLLAGDEAFIVNCTGGESTLDSQCQKALKQAKDALAELGDTDNGYTNTTQYIELQLALDALTNNASGRGSVFQTNLDSITNTSLR
ncbi:hypothetical protein HN588_01560, partial [Candidatus Bathyarchaeota archaeon]|nr:hypothetical protein [Candidatus Bathyarchaeota archaeon]